MKQHELMDNHIERLFDHYIENATAFVNKQSIYDSITGKSLEPDEKFMDQIENIITGCTSCPSKNFREMMAGNKQYEMGIIFNARNEILTEACKYKLILDTHNYPPDYFGKLKLLAEHIANIGKLAGIPTTIQE